MPKITELLEYGGVPEGSFISVPQDSYNVVWIEGSKGKVSYTNDGKTSIQKVTKDNAAKIAENVGRHHTSGHKASGDYGKDLLARMNALINSNPGEVLAIQGKKLGYSKIEVTADGTKLKFEAGIAPQRVYNISYRFLQHPDGGKNVPDTAYTPKSADGWIPILNRFYGPQANIIFDLVDSDWVTAPSAVSQPVGRDFFLKSIAVKPTEKKTVVMHLVGKWGGGDSGHSRGTYFNDTGVAVVTDKPNQDEIPAGIDPFMLTMAHEILHFIREKRGLPGGHPPRDGILLSSKIQTPRIDKQMSMDINPPGG